MSKKLPAPGDTQKYEKHYDEGRLWKKIPRALRRMGAWVIFDILRLYYVATSPGTPKHIKAALFGALGYFISPIDVIPDFIPIAGFTDDAAVIAGGVALAHMFITDDINEKARERYKKFFGAYPAQ